MAVVFFILIIVVNDAQLPAVRSFVFNSDPSSFCEVKIKNKNGVKKTQIRQSTKCPQYKEEFVLLVEETDILFFRVMQYRNKGIDLQIGSVEVDLEEELRAHQGEFKDRVKIICLQSKMLMIILIFVKKSYRGLFIKNHD